MPRESGVFAEVRQRQGGTPSVGHRRSSVWVIVARTIGVVGVGFGIGYLVTLLVLLPAQGDATDLVQVPELVGRTAESARELLSRRGLEYAEATSLYHPEAPAGVVVAQNLLPGQVARPGAQVRVTLSLGPRQRQVPDVGGLSRRQAEIVLERAGFRADVTFVDADANVGEVISTDPTAGTEVRLPGSVRLLVSAGPPRVEIPDLVTRSLPEAQSTLERLGLRVGQISRDWASQAAAGTVIGQSPGPGSVVDRGTSVSLTVAVVPPVEPGDTAGIGRQPAGTRRPIGAADTAGPGSEPVDTTTAAAERDADG